MFQGSEDLILLTWQYSSNRSQIQPIPTRIWRGLFVETDTLILKFIRTQKSQKNAEKEKQCWKNDTPQFQNLPQTTVIKRVWYWRKNRYIDQQNSIDSPEINPFIYGQLTFGKGTKTIQWEKESLFNKWCWNNWITTGKRMKLDPYPTPYAKINSKYQIKDLNVRAKSTKLLGKKHRGNSSWHWIWQWILGYDTKAQTTTKK